MFMGCDDLMHPNFVETVKAAHREFPAAATLQVGVQVIDEHDAPIDPLTDRVKRAIRGRVTRRRELGGEHLATSLLRGAWHYWPALVFRTDRVTAYPFRDGLPIIQDLALLIDMTAAGETLVVDPTVCFSYRRHTAERVGLQPAARRPLLRRAALLRRRRRADGRPRLAAGRPDRADPLDLTPARGDAAADGRASARAQRRTHAARPHPGALERLSDARRARCGRPPASPGPRAPS